MDVQTLEEIEAAYPDEWVLLDDAEMDDETGEVRGRLIFHSEDRDEVDAEIDRLPLPRNFGIFFARGPRSQAEDLVFIL